MKNIIKIHIILVGLFNILDAGMLTNNGNIPVNVIEYNDNYRPINAKNNRSSQGRIKGQGYLIPAGQNIDLEKNATSIDVFYSPDKPGIHITINPNNSYTLNPDAPTWTVTQD